MHTSERGECDAVFDIDYLSSILKCVNYFSKWQLMGSLTNNEYFVARPADPAEGS
jgi:hypothetical protein